MKGDKKSQVCKEKFGGENNNPIFAARLDKTGVH
jgi:hypothetical protein